jgi:hypothetical protein
MVVHRYSNEARDKFSIGCVGFAMIGQKVQGVGLYKRQRAQLGRSTRHFGVLPVDLGRYFLNEFRIHLDYRSLPSTGLEARLAAFAHECRKIQVVGRGTAVREAQRL